jgi:CO/xanthine dehydrogenase FAD-binding subunit
MKAFDFYAAKDTNDAVALLAQHAANSKLKIIAGGTDLLADWKF